MACNYNNIALLWV